MWLAWRRSPGTNSLMRYSFTVFLPLAVVTPLPDGSKLRGKVKQNKKEEKKVLFPLFSTRQKGCTPGVFRDGGRCNGSQNDKQFLKNKRKKQKADITAAISRSRSDDYTEKYPDDENAQVVESRSLAFFSDRHS